MRKLIRLRNAGFIARRTALLIAPLVLTACAVGPNYVKPETKVGDQFGSFDAQAFTKDQAVTRFWSLFGDDLLDSLVAESLAANHDLRIALARFTEARAARRQSRFNLFPTITASGGYTKQRLTEEQAAVSALPERNESFYDAGFDAIWELDLFGRVRRGVEASRADAESAEASLRDAQVIVIAEVVRTYLELRGEQSRLEVARHNVQNQRESYDLANVRLDAGRGTELDTSRAQAQLSTTLASIGPLEAAVAGSIHRLSVLTGRQPTELRDRLAPVRDLPAVPAVSAVGNPADLLRRRPDIRVAERNLAAATARVGVAVGDLFPVVSFTGNIGFAATLSGDLGKSGTDTFLLAPGISWAALDLGRVRARISGARARTEGALAAYERAVLGALEETETALVFHARAKERLTYLAAAADASAVASRLARVRYEGGISDFLQVLDAERTQLEAEDALAQSRTDVATSLVAVFKALGGAWVDAPLPGPR
ncbi:MAG: efflux transporter outer membrane subunit [Gammaproteobacteria bacterium]